MSDAIDTPDAVSGTSAASAGDATCSGEVTGSDDAAGASGPIDATGGGDTWFGLDADAKPLVRAGVVLGVGLGGFFDGIVFHQVLQTHSMLTAHSDPAVAGDRGLNVLADGLFHVATYLLTVAGVVLLWRAWRTPAVPPSGRTLLGAALVGWGGFNLVEGLVNHHLLGIHHVWPTGPGEALVWDLAFLAWGAAFVALGVLAIRRDPSVAVGRRNEAAQAAE